jgi:hypothetical protein
MSSRFLFNSSLSISVVFLERGNCIDSVNVIGGQSFKLVVMVFVDGINSGDISFIGGFFGGVSFLVILKSCDKSLVGIYINILISRLLC